MSPVAHSGPAVPPSKKTMAFNDATRAAGKGPHGGVPHNGYSGSGKASFRHIDDVVSVNVDLDPHTPLRKVIEVGDNCMQQATTYKTFGRLDLALQEYIKAFTIAVDKVPKHKEYPSLKSDRGDLNRSYHALKVKITNNGVAFDNIKEIIKQDNLRSGVCPEKPVAKSPPNFLDLPSVPSNLPLQHSADNADVRISRGQSMKPDSQAHEGYSHGRKTKPVIHPKPQSLHGNSVKVALDKPSPDLAARFAKLRDPLEHRHNSPPPPPAKPTGPRAMPLPHRTPLSVQSSLPAMPKLPDAIYSPARGTVTSEAANLPSSTPRGMFSRTNSVVSMSGTSSRNSMENIFKPVSREQFVTAHTYGDTQASPTRNLHIPGGDLITVKELLRCMEDASANANVKILLIDVRDRQLFDEGHIMSQSTICLDPTVLSRQNISTSEIVDSMILAPSSEKLAFERRDEVDLVVFYDQDSESLPQRITSNIQEAIIFNLRQALIHYSFSKQLAHAPKLLVGGIAAWVDELGQQSLQTSKTQEIPRNTASTSASTRQRLRNRTLKPEEVNTFEAMIGRDETGDFDYVKSRDDFMRRFPSIREPESMISNEQDGSSISNTGSGGEEFLNDMTPVPPIRPKPSVARTRYSGLESTDEHSPPGGLAMAATASATPRNAQINITGLINPGNWCYANASIQALLSASEFMAEFLDTQWPTKYRPTEKQDDPTYNQLMCRILGNLFHWLSQKSFDSMKASTLMHYLRTIHTGYLTPAGKLIRFGDTNQHDSDELIIFILGQLEAETNIKLTKNLLPPLDTTQATGFLANHWGNRHHTIVSKYWYTVELHTFTCNNCKAENFVAADSERFLVPVPLDRNNGSLNELIEEHFEEEQVESECDKCKSRGKSLRKQVARMPPLLRVGLIRTDQTSSIKVSNHFQFPLDALTFKNHVFKANERQQIAKLLGGDAADGFNGAPDYHLFAVVAHAGRDLHSGHYVCFIRNDGNSWRKVDDTMVGPLIHHKEVSKAFHQCENGFTPVQLYYRRSH